MSTTDCLPAPEIGTRPHSKWDQEYQAFLRLRASLLSTHHGQYVAVHNEQVVDAGDDQIEVATRVYNRFGYQPIYVGLVSDQPATPARIPSPTVLPKTTPQ